MTYYPGFTKALAELAADPRCNACGREIDYCNGMTGATCTYCCEIWYDGPLAEEDRRNPTKIGEYCLKAEREGLWPFGPLALANESKRQ